MARLGLQQQQKHEAKLAAFKHAAASARPPHVIPVPSREVTAGGVPPGAVTAASALITIARAGTRFAATVAAGILMACKITAASKIRMAVPIPMASQAVAGRMAFRFSVLSH
ncbi:MAG: hypothetical protein U1E42_02795 [Rhodospirillales bacterium]